MLSYRHAYHAGNHADVLKHCIQSLLLTALCRKDKPFIYLDTHSGAGRYDLTSAMATKNGEFRTGIDRLWHTRNPPESAAPYLFAVGQLNPRHPLRSYPGSPRIARALLRPGDRLLLNEIHPTDLALLKHEFADDARTRIHQFDAYEALKALLPPKERRGLVLIDPAFELKTERQRLLDGLQEAKRRWSTGIYAVWYPLIDRHFADDLLRRLGRQGWDEIIVAELTVGSASKGASLSGSGMAVINPPWQLDTQLRELLPWLADKLGVSGGGGYRLQSLKPASPATEASKPT